MLHLRPDAPIETRSTGVSRLYHRVMKRRLVTVPSLVIAAVLLIATLPLWLVVGAIVDLVRSRRRLPTVRLFSFALLWAWIETVGVTVAFLFWLTGQSRRLSIHYALQRWWAARLMWALRVSCGVRVVVDNVDVLRPGPTLVMARHASLADSLVSAYVITSLARMNPRYVLKRELKSEPCLDIVGHRLPNHFLDREAEDSAPGLAALSDMVSTLGSNDVGVIFPEGTRANPVKRERALTKIGATDPARAARVGAIRHLLPPRPAGARALLDGHPTADVVFAWHIGFEGLDTFPGIYRALARPMPEVRFSLHRVARSDVPTIDHENMGALTEWLDREWLRMDAEVDRALAERK